MVSTQVLMSSKASFKPWKKVCDSASFQSSSPVNQDVVLGKFGSTKNAEKAMTTVMAPSMRNLSTNSANFLRDFRNKTYTHLQARRPCVPSMLLVIPAVTKPPKAPEIRLPEYKMAVRSPSSFLVYQELR
jgi:hypothetical protein